MHISGPVVKTFPYIQSASQELVMDMLPDDS